MDEYHVGCGLFGIYAGTLKPRNKNEWSNKSNVTQEALSAVAQYLLVNEKELRFDYCGTSYVMKVERRTDGERQSD